MNKLIAVVLFAVTGLGAACAAESAIGALRSEIQPSVVEAIEMPLPEIIPLKPDWSVACERNAISAIMKLSQGISSYAHPTIENVRAVVAIASSCNSSYVRATAARACSGGVSSYSEPTESVAQSMEGLCGNDMHCAIAAIVVLGNGISSFTRPTVNVAKSIVKIVKQAPYEEVKSAAIHSLSRGISSYSHPTMEVSAAIAEVGNCAMHP